MLPVVVQTTLNVLTVKNVILELESVLMMLEKMVMTARAAIVKYVSTVNVKMLFWANLAQVLMWIVESVMVQVVVIQVIMMMINVKEIRVNIATQEVVLITLMGRNHPVGIVLASLLFGALYQGGAELDFEFSTITREMVLLIQGLIILFSGGLAYMFNKPLAHLLGALLSQRDKTDHREVGQNG